MRKKIISIGLYVFAALTIFWFAKPVGASCVCNKIEEALEFESIEEISGGVCDIVAEESIWRGTKQSMFFTNSWEEYVKFDINYSSNENDFNITSRVKKPVGFICNNKKEILVFKSIEKVSQPEQDTEEELPKWDGEQVYFYLDNGSHPAKLDIHRSLNLVTTLVIEESI